MASELQKELDRFLFWSSELILDSGEKWAVEDFQRDFIRDVLAGVPECWLVVPEGNGKTTLVAGLCLYHCAHTTRAKVPVGAAAREQAEEVYRQAEIFVTETPGLSRQFRCYEGYRRISCADTRGVIQIKAADERTGDGGIPTLYVLDELHRHRGLGLYRTWRGKITKRGAQIIAISTAGEPGSEFESTRARILKEASKIDRHGAHIRAEGEGLVLHDWAVRDRARVGNMRSVAAANPLKALTPDVLKTKRNSKTMTDAHWLRMNCNIAAREEGEAVTPEVWDALGEKDLEPDLSAWKVGWLDLGWEIDCAAAGVLIWESFERRVITGVRVIEPPVDEADVVNAILDVVEEYGVEAFVYDPNAGGKQMAQMLEKGTHPDQVARKIGPITFIEHTQDNAPMCEAARVMDEAIRNKWLVHDGDEALKAHVMNSIKRTVYGEKWRYDRPLEAKGAKRKNFPNDAWIGAVMGHSVAFAEQNAPKPQPAFALA